MELKRYLRLVIRHRWLALGAFALTITATAILIFSQASYYESSGTLVVRPRVVESSDVIRAIDTLTRGGEINATYAAIARSDRILDRAGEHFESGETPDAIAVSADVLIGTNLISIVVRATDPENARALADAIGAETMSYVDELGDVFQIESLDAPQLPSRPAGPNRFLTMLVGFVVATFLAVGIAVLAEQLDVPPA